MISTNTWLMKPERSSPAEESQSNELRLLTAFLYLLLSAGFAAGSMHTAGQICTTGTQPSKSAFETRKRELVQLEVKEKNEPNRFLTPVAPLSRASLHCFPY